jgi:hypothetical protein
MRDLFDGIFDFDGSGSSDRSEGSPGSDISKPASLRIRANSNPREDSTGPSAADDPDDLGSWDDEDY